MSTQEIVRFYDYTFTDEAVQQQLIRTQGMRQFMDKVLEIATHSGFQFTRQELESTFDGMGERKPFASPDDPWIRKIMSMGWVPKGYSR